MSIGEKEKLKAAYALNLWTVSVSQIVDYDDVNIMDQEYDTILNNLNLENMPKDETLLDVIKQILDTITYYRVEAGDKKMVELEYQHQLKNAVWNAVPNVGAIFATSNPIAMGATLATQVGIGYMNYRRNKAEYEMGYEKSKWQIQRGRLQQLNGLQKQLFETAWRLADTYEFSDEYRLTAKQISEYNRALMESNPVKRFNNLNAMKEMFSAYPVFWYQLGSTANSIYRSAEYASEPEIKSLYKEYAIEYFEKYNSLNTFDLLRHDVLTSSWALEYLELLDANQNNNLEKAKELIKLAEKNSGNAYDVLELCAFAYLRIQDYENATRVFHFLVNNSYNAIINTQILSALYIRDMCGDNPDKAKLARIGYKQLPRITDEKFILSVPSEGTDLSKWKPEWEQKKSFEEKLQEKARRNQWKNELRDKAIKKARPFYQRRIVLVYAPGYEGIAEYFKGILDGYRGKIKDESIPFASIQELKEYKKNSSEIEKNGTHVILIGDSDEAKKMYKNVKNARWDYYHLGMRYMTYGNKTVLLARKIKNDQIDDLIQLAKDLQEKYELKIPDGVESVKYTVLRDMYKDYFKKKEDIAVDVFSTIITSPLAVLAQIGENVCNDIQYGKNLLSAKELEKLQYSVAIYRYLESENAISIVPYKFMKKDE